MKCFSKSGMRLTIKRLLGLPSKYIHALRVAIYSAFKEEGGYLEYEITLWESLFKDDYERNDK